MIWRLILLDKCQSLWMQPLGCAVAASYVLFGIKYSTPEARFAAAAALFLWFSFFPSFRSPQADSPVLTTLPISVRELFLARAIPLWAALILQLGSATAALALSGVQVGSLPFTFWFAAGGLATSALCAAFSGPPLPGWIAFVALFILGPAIRMAPASLFHNLPLNSALLLVTLASALFAIRTWRTLPSTFLVAPIDPAQPKKLSKPAVETRSPWLLILRASWFWTRLAAIVPIILMALMPGQVTPLVLITHGPAWESLRDGANWLFTLPIRRLPLILMLLVPEFLILIAGYEVTIRINLGSPTAREVSLSTEQEPREWKKPIDRPDCKTPNVLVSADFWIPAGPEPSVIVSPWGESFAPPLHREPGFNVYNPYAVGCGNSDRFLDWQFERATAAVYGRALKRNSGESLENLVSIPPARSQIIAIGLIATYHVLGLCLALFADGTRMRRYPFHIRFAIGVGFIGVLTFLDISGKLTLTRLLTWVLPTSIPVVTLIMLAATAASLALAAALLRKVDVISRQLPPGYQYGSFKIR